MQDLDCLNALLNCFTKLPGVGYKTAERYAYRVVEMSRDEASHFANAIMAVKDQVKFCRTCGNFTTGEQCRICATRTGDTLCVVAYPKEIAVIERCHAFNGTYHVLHGVLSPLNKKGPEQLNIKSLMTRLAGGQISEVILALSPDVEGEATANYLAALIKPCGVKVSRLATGIAMGVALEYADELTIGTALRNRTEV